MEEIMYQMLLQDQFLKHHPLAKRQADTSLVYDGIFQQYGYKLEDFDYSLSYYLEDASRMEKIMGRVAARLEADGKLAADELHQYHWRESFLRLYKKQPDTLHLPQPHSLLDSLVLQFASDSLLYVNHTAWNASQPDTCSH